MRTKVTESEIALWASQDDTYRWARRTGSAWPCSTLSGKRLFAAFDSNGLVELAINGKDAGDDIDGWELSCLCSDLLKKSGKVPQEHPAYFVAVGQFQD